MKRANNFGSAIQKGTFKCGNCGRNTRSTGDNTELCPQCWDAAGLENEIEDCCNCTHEAVCTEHQETSKQIDALYAEAKAKGGKFSDADDVPPGTESLG